MATVYHAEGNLENAYILYIKFMTLFLDKILSHPEYKTGIEVLYYNYLVCPSYQYFMNDVL